LVLCVLWAFFFLVVSSSTLLLFFMVAVLKKFRRPYSACCFLGIRSLFLIPVAALLPHLLNFASEMPLGFFLKFFLPIKSREGPLPDERARCPFLKIGLAFLPPTQSFYLISLGHPFSSLTFSKATFRSPMVGRLLP